VTCDIKGCERVAAWIVEASPTRLRTVCDEHKRWCIEGAVKLFGHGDSETEKVIRESMEGTAHPLVSEGLN
jgi:hypothetical protein